MTSSVRERSRVLTELSGPGVGTLVTGLFLLMVGGTMYVIAPASVLTVVIDRLGIGQTAAGWIISVVFGVQVLISVPSGIGIDRFSNRRVLIGSAAAIAVAGVWGYRAALRGEYWSLMASRALGGAALAVAWNVSVNVIRRVIEADRRATVLGIYTASAPVGFVIAHLSGSVVVGQFGWAAIFVVPTALVVAGAVFFTAGSHKRDLSGATTARPQIADFSRVLTDGRVWSVSVLAFLAYSVYLFVNSWVPTYLTTELGFSLGQSGLLVALFPAIGILSRSGGGVIVDRLFDSRRRPVVLASFLVTAPVVAILATVRTFALVFLTLIIAGFFIQLGIGLFYAHIGELVEPNVAATAIALVTGLGFLGSFSAPIIAGAVIEATGSYLFAFGYAVVMALAGIGLTWRLEES